MTELLPPGTRVEVRTGFDRSWAKGFEVAGTSAEAYRVRRLSDGMELPRDFPVEDVRRERQPSSMWWV